MGDARRLTDTAEELRDVQAAVDVIVEHLGLERQVRDAVSDRRAKARRSEVEIARSLESSGEREDPRR